AERHAGLLDEQEHTWLVAHLSACDDCRAIGEDLAARSEFDAATSGHLPSRLISRWDTESPGLPEVVRDLVLAHLRTCELWRRGVELGGPALPAETREAAHPAPAVMPKPAWRARLAYSRTRFWLAAGGLAAAAAALLIAFHLPDRARIIAG